MTERRRGRSSPRVQNSESSDVLMRIVGVVAICAIGLFVVLWDGWDREVLADVPAEPWIARLPSEWPRVVLTNHIRVRGHPSVDGGAAYLAGTSDGRVLAISARDVLRGLADKASHRPDRFNVLLESWTLTSANCAENIDEPPCVGCAGLSTRARPFSDSEIVIADTESPRSPPPAVALKIFSSRVRVGESVFVAVPSEMNASGQRILRGKALVVTPGGERIDVRLDEKVHADGFAGSPLINAKGYTVGVVTGTFPFAEDAAGRTYVLVCEGLRPLRIE